MVRQTHSVFVTALPLAVDVVMTDPRGVPLTRQLTIRMSQAMYASIVTRSLIEQAPEAEIARRWIRRGALAEGINTDEL